MAPYWSIHISCRDRSRSPISRGPGGSSTAAAGWSADDLAELQTLKIQRERCQGAIDVAKVHNNFWTTILFFTVNLLFLKHNFLPFCISDMKLSHLRCEFFFTLQFTIWFKNFQYENQVFERLNILHGIWISFFVCVFLFRYLPYLWCWTITYLKMFLFSN